MIKLLSIFVLSALLSAAFQLAGSGCASEDESCECPAPEAWPPQKAARPISEAKNTEAMDRTEAAPIDLSQATIAVTDEQVVIRYQVDGAARAIVYDILPNS